MDEAYEILLAAYRKEVKERYESEARLLGIVDTLQQQILKAGIDAPLVGSSKEVI